MLSDPQRFLMMMEGGAVFGLVLCMWLVVILVIARRRAAREERVDQRLMLPEMQRGGKPRVLRLFHGDEAATMVVPGKQQRSMKAKIQLLYRDTGFQMPLKTMVFIVISLMAMTYLVTLVLFSRAVVSAAAAVVIPVAAYVYMNMRIDGINRLFETQFLEALGLATRSLRAGYSLPAPFRLITEEMEPPVTEVFEEICQLSELGLSIEDALRRVGEDSPSADFRLFCSAMIIQLRSGGNVADLMDRLTIVIQNRIKIHRKVRILTAQAQFSKRILLALPFLLFLMLNVLNPEYMSTLYVTEAGRMLLVVAAGMLLLGTWIMNKIAKLQY